MASPRKSRLKPSTDKPLKRTPVLSAREAARQRIQERRLSKESRNITEVEPIIPMPPKTPAAMESIFSPQSEVFSSERPTGNDTPPPQEVPGRGSRRARSAVNYAEPSLISKMRRPTKELVDAVGKDGRPLHGAIIKRIDKPTSQWKPAYSANVAESTTRDEPPSPLKNKASSITKEVEVEESSVKEPVPKPRRRSQAVRFQPSDEEVRKAEMAIFDFTDSSPSETSISKKATKTSGSRRHSTVGSTAGGVVKEKADLKRHTASQTGAGAGRRRSMMV
jgi:hypothetical protein